MTNLRLVILLIIIFIAGVTGIYWIYQSQVNTDTNLLPVPTPTAGTQESETSEVGTETSAEVGSIADRLESESPAVQPEAGSDTLTVNNVGIKVNSPNAGIQITSPLIVSGTANVLGGKVIVKVIDGKGNVLGQNQATACIGYDACNWQTTVNFSPSETQAGTLTVYSPSTIDNSPNNLQTLLVRF